MKIALVTDSTAYLTKEMIEKNNIFVTPLNVVFDEESYREGEDITTSEFYEKVKSEKKLPTTSQPSIGELINLYESLSKDYDAIISIHISQKLSGTFDASQSAGQMVENVKVFSIDSAISTLPQGFLVLEAAEMIKEGKDVVEIVERIEELSHHTRAYFMVDDLSHLQRGGRLSGAQALVGSLLNIKPVLHIEDGRIEQYEKIRTKKKALRKMISLLEADISTKNVLKVVFIHGNDEETALTMQKEFLVNYPEVDTYISYFGPVIGTHLGEGSLGVAWYFEK